MPTLDGINVVLNSSLGTVPVGNSFTPRRGKYRWLKFRDQGLGKRLTSHAPLHGGVTQGPGNWGTPAPPINLYTYRRGVTVDAREFPGWSATTPWTNRFWVFPLNVDHKTILTDTDGYFQVFNTFRDTTTHRLLSIVATGSGYEGMTVLERVAGYGTTTATFGGSTLPRVFNPRTGQTYKYTILGEGTPDINIVLTLDVESTDVGDPVLNLIGTRALVWPFISQKPLTEKLSFLTNVMEARDGTEQRITTRTSPRQSYDMKYYLTGPDREEQWQYAQALLVGRGGQPLGVGLWHQARKLTAVSAITSDIITLDTSGMDFRVGEFALIYREWNVNEIVKILSVSATGLTISSGVTREYVPGDYCVPAQLCVAADGVGFREGLQNLSTINASWDPISVTATLNDFSDLYSAWSPPGSTYDPMPLVVDPNFVGKDGLDHSINHDINVLDKKTGPIKYFTRKSTPTVSFQKTWETDGTDAMVDAMALRKFLYWSKGRLKSFWIPSSKPDFTVVADVLTSVPDLVVIKSGYGDRIGVNEPYDHVVIKYTGASGIAPTYHKISSVTQDFPVVGQATLHLTHGSAAVPLGGFANTFTVADVASVEFLFRARFDADMANLKHTGQGRTTLSMPVMGIKQ